MIESALFFIASAQFSILARAYGQPMETWFTLVSGFFFGVGIILAIKDICT